MIRAFPDLYPGELIYGGYARYARRVGYPNLKNVMNELFGSQHVIASIPFASHLDYFVAHQPYADRFAAESLVAEHTLLPFYTPFLPPKYAEQLQMNMRGANGQGIYMRIGLMASTIPSPFFLRYCPGCAKEDEMRFGEKYWHRHHQIPGVYVCHIHNMWLEQSDVLIHDRKTRHRFIAAEEALRPLTSPRAIDTSSNLSETLLFIANSAAWLLQQRELLPGLEFLHDAYMRALIRHGLATYSCRIRMTELQEAFVSYYPDDVLPHLHCSLNRQSPDNWLARLVRKPGGSQHPLQHLLLMHFLGSPIEAFFSNSLEDSHPFGTGPWPCLNAASDHYQQRHIEHCETAPGQYVGGRPVGIFSCPCGFVYSRTGPDTSIEDQFRFSKIKAFGPIWETKLQALWRGESVSLRGIARQLGVDPLTIKRHATRLCLPFPRPRGISSSLRENQQLRPDMLKKSDATTIQAYRTSWLTSIRTNPGAGVTKLRGIIPGIYTRLYRHDKIWLKAHTPTCTKKKIGYHRVDWAERDAELAEKVIFVATRLRDLPGRPIHLTISAIGRELGQVALLQQHLDKLPKTAQALKEHVDSQEAYALRRIQWALLDCIHNKSQPARWLLIKKAGVARLVEQAQIKDAIDQALLFLHPNLALCNGHSLVEGLLLQEFNQ
jgi:hypothetical protein